MRLMTCTGCVSAGACDIAAEKRKALKGLGITTVKFMCKQRRDVFQPGQAVIFITFTSADDGEGGVEEVRYPGHVIQQMRGKVLGYIKPNTRDLTDDIPFEAKANGFVKIPLARVRADDKRQPVALNKCRWCAIYIDLEPVSSSCHFDPNYTGSMCAMREAAKAGEVTA